MGRIDRMKLGWDDRTGALGGDCMARRDEELSVLLVFLALFLSLSDQVGLGVSLRLLLLASMKCGLGLGRMDGLRPLEHMTGICQGVHVGTLAHFWLDSVVEVQLDNVCSYACAWAVLSSPPPQSMNWLVLLSVKEDEQTAWHKSQNMFSFVNSYVVLVQILLRCDATRPSTP